MKVMNSVEMQNVNAGFRLFTYGSCNYCGYYSMSFGTFGAISVYNTIAKHCKQNKHFNGASFVDKKLLW